MCVTEINYNSYLPNYKAFLILLLVQAPIQEQGKYTLVDILNSCHHKILFPGHIRERKINNQLMEERCISHTHKIPQYSFSVCQGLLKVWLYFFSWPQDGYTGSNKYECTCRDVSVGLQKKLSILRSFIHLKAIFKPKEATEMKRWDLPQVCWKRCLGGKLPTPVWRCRGWCLTHCWGRKASSRRWGLSEP